MCHRNSWLRPDAGWPGEWHLLLSSSSAPCAGIHFCFTVQSSLGGFFWLWILVQIELKKCRWEQARPSLAQNKCGPSILLIICFWFPHSINYQGDSDCNPLGYSNWYWIFLKYSFIPDVLHSAGASCLNTNACLKTLVFVEAVGLAAGVVFQGKPPSRKFQAYHTCDTIYFVCFEAIHPPKFQSQH